MAFWTVERVTSFPFVRSESELIWRLQEMP